MEKWFADRQPSEGFRAFEGHYDLSRDDSTQTSPVASFADGGSGRLQLN